jgi:hypothetical protein
MSCLRTQSSTSVSTDEWGWIMQIQQIARRAMKDINTLHTAVPGLIHSVEGVDERQSMAFKDGKEWSLRAII